MTIDHHPRGAGRGPGDWGERRRVATAQAPERSTKRDLERYAGLFASRTRVMRSSAMRDMMAVTARPEVISLAGGLPDTSTFPPDTFAAVTTRIAAESCAKALQYGPTEGLDEAKACIAEVMAAEEMHVDPADVIVTTGGQQVIDLVTKTLIDPGDVVVAEAPTYPGAVPVFSSYQADVGPDRDRRRRHARRPARGDARRGSSARARRPKFIYTIPSFQNPAGVTMALSRRRRLVEVARERELLILEDNPYGLLRYEGTSDPTLYSLDGGLYTMYLGTFSKILSPGIRLGWVVAPPPVLREDQPRQAGRRPLHLDALPAHGQGVLRPRRVGRLRRLAHRDLPRAPGHDARLAGGVLPARGRVDAPGGRALHLGHAARLHRHDRPARAGAEENVAFVPGEGAYLDGRGRDAMRLNFSGSGEDAIREGVRRIGKVVGEQVALYRDAHGAVATRRSHTS